MCTQTRFIPQLYSELNKMLTLINSMATADTATPPQTRTSQIPSKQRCYNTCTHTVTLKSQKHASTNAQSSISVPVLHATPSQWSVSVPLIMYQ